MSALTYMIDGGMALIGGDLQKSQQQRIKKLAKAFGQKIRQLGVANDIPASALSVWQASFFLGGIDTQRVYFIFADAAGGTQLQYRDLSQHGSVGLNHLAADIRSHVGDPVFVFELPISVLEQPETMSQRMMQLVNISLAFYKNLPRKLKIMTKLMKVFASS